MKCKKPFSAHLLHSLSSLLPIQVQNYWNINDFERARRSSRWALALNIVSVVSGINLFILLLILLGSGSYYGIYDD